jgi:hypothetical protein
MRTRASVISYHELMLYVFQQANHDQMLLICTLLLMMSPGCSYADLLFGSDAQGPSCEAGQEIHCLLWNLKGHYHVYKILPLDPILSELIQSIPSHPVF